MQFSNMSLIPRPVPSEISRSHLLSLFLPQNLRVIALLAPSGYGKTTLLAQFARLNPSSFWLSLSDDSQDLLFFAHSLRDALSPLELPTFAAHLSESPSPSPSSLGRAFLQDLAFLPPITVCIDQIQHLGTASAAFLNVVFGGMREPNRVLLSGYAPEALKLAELLSKNVALVLGPEELKFTESEVEEYLGRKKSKMGVGELGFLEGWPAGLSLQTSVSSMYADPQRLIGELLSDLLVEYPEMPKLSVLSVWSTSHIQTLGLPPKILDVLWSQGHLLVPLARHTYRPHRLLRTALDAFLKQTPSLYIQAHRQAGLLCQEEGKPLEALKHYKIAGAVKNIFEILRLLAPRYLDRWEYHLLHRLFEGLEILSLPLDLLEVYTITKPYGDESISWAECLKFLEEVYDKGGRSHLLFQELSTMEYYLNNREKTLEWLDRGLGEPHLRDSLTLLRGKIIRLYFDSTTPERQALVEYVLALSERQPDLRQKAVTWTICGTAYIAIGEYAEGHRLARKAAEIFHDQENWHYHRRALDAMLGAQIGLGHWDQAREIADFLQQVESGIKFFLPVFFLLNNQMTEFLLFSRTSDIKALEFEALSLMGRRAEATQLYEELKNINAYALRKNCEAPEIHIGIGLYALGRVEEGKKYIQDGLKNVVHEFTKYRALLYLDKIGEAEIDLRFLKIIEFDKHIIDRQKVNISEIEEIKALQQIEIYTFGKFEILYTGTKKSLANRKSQEILVFLIINGESSREEIIDAVWGESSDWSIADYFKVSIYRLRQFLKEMGIHNAIVQEKSYYRVSEEYTWSLDTEKLNEENPPIGDLYHGIWMSKSESEWFEEKREEIRIETYRAMLRWANTDPQWLERALVCEPLEEEAYKRAIERWIEMNQPERARTLYLQMTQLWLKELGTLPQIPAYF